MFIILYIWQLPQHLIALFFLIFSEKIEFNKSNVFYSCKVINSGLSLGNYIFLPAGSPFNETLLKHEIGHSIQSKYLGWFYLIVIGMPSLANNIVSRFNNEYAKNYYNKFPENWADKLGGVKRS